MRRLLFIALCVLAVSACKQEKPKVEAAVVQQQQDSLNQIIVQKENELNDMIGTMNEIEEGLREINEAQNRVNLAKRNGEGENRAERIRENIQFIQSTMKQNRELVNKLRQQMRESSFKSDQLRRTIDNLTKQLDEKDKQMQELRAELDAKDIHITELDEQVANLNTNVSDLQTVNMEQSQRISAQDKQIHTAWYVFGTKEELKEQNILVKNKVLQSNFNRNYFTKIDIRVDKEIKFYSPKAEILTSHPAGSYTLQPDANKQYVLRITNPQTFWSTSKYLVVLVK